MKYDKFLNLLIEKRKLKGFSQDNIAEIIGTERSNYSRKEKGKVPLTVDELLKILPMLNLEIKNIFQELPDAVNDRDVIRRDVYYMARGGDPLEPQLIEGEPIDTIYLKKEFLSGNIVPVKVYGDSMAPTIYSGAIVGIDKNDCKPVSGALFALYFPYEGAVVKRINIDPKGMFHIISDHTDKVRFPTYSINPKELNEHFIQGRVKWVIQQY